MSNFETEEFCDYLNIKLSNLFKSNCYLANQLIDNFVSTFAEVVDYLRLREKQLKKKKRTSFNPGYHLAYLNLFKPKTKCLERLRKFSDHLAMIEKYKA